MTNLEALRLLQKVERKLLGISQNLTLIETKEEDMAGEIRPEVAAILQQVDSATTAIGQRIATLVAGSSGLNEAEKAAFQVEIDKLTQLGADGSV